MPIGDNGARPRWVSCAFGHCRLPFGILFTEPELRSQLGIGSPWTCGGNKVARHKNPKSTNDSRRNRLRTPQDGVACASTANGNRRPTPGHVFDFATRHSPPDASGPPPSAPRPLPIYLLSSAKLPTLQLKSGSDFPACTCLLSLCACVCVCDVVSVCVSV